VWWIERLEALKIGGSPINKLSEVFARRGGRKA
jgi:hypothetical protein